MRCSRVEERRPRSATTIGQGEPAQLIKLVIDALRIGYKIRPGSGVWTDLRDDYREAKIAAEERKRQLSDPEYIRRRERDASLPCHCHLRCGVHSSGIHLCLVLPPSATALMG